MKFYIKEAREKAGYSQKELAKLIGVAPSTFHGYENGDHDPKSELLIQIANACGVSVDYLLGVADETPSSTPDPTLDPKADEFARLFSQLPAEQQELVLSAMRGMTKDKE